MWAIDAPALPHENAPNQPPSKQSAITQMGRIVADSTPAEPKLSEKLTEAERKLEEVRTESDKTQGRHEKECRELSSQTKTLKGEKAATRRSASAWRTEDLASQIRNASESVALPHYSLSRS
ncbi:hypothetical protein EGYY_00270 [Eggerthella sp. YY7918]|nr:hypothetical protein EGYY_00270 [Eggerthella sp. YY7918]